MPCPLCSSHAKSLLRKYKVEHVKTKDSLIYIIIKLHNDVNKRLRKPIQEASVMKEYYKTLNTREIIQDYYNKNINMRFGEKMMMHSFHRKMFLTKFKSYIRTNIEYFDEWYDNDLFCHGGNEFPISVDLAFELLLAWHGTHLFIW